MPIVCYELFEFMTNNISKTYTDKECPNQVVKQCVCVVIKHTRQIWETWYFWFGVILLCVFIITSLLSYGLGTCKRRKHHLVRINNTVPQSATISTIFGPGGIIQPLVNLKNSPIQQEGETKVTAYIGSSTLKVEDIAEPLSPAYPASQPVTLVRGPLPARGFRHTPTYTELVLPPGFVEAEKH